GALLVVARRDLDRIAGVAQLDEVDALDDASGRHVEAGNDAFGEHGVSVDYRGPARAEGCGSGGGEFVGARLRRGEIEVAAVDRPAADHALDSHLLNGAQALDVLHRRQATRGEHGNRELLRQL